MSWQRVRGHEAQIEAFERAVRRGRLAHAYLFAGPPGVGKRLFARELARALLCEGKAHGPQPVGLNACDHCTACALVDANTHPDFFAVARPEGSNELPIEVMRELCRGFALTSSRGRGKVCVLDDADDLNDASANCFLKTLEEPPPRSVFILVGTGSERQLPTIVSRCQVVRFAPLPEATVTEILQGQELPDTALIPRLARLAGGSPGQALALAEPALWVFRRQLLEKLLRPQPDTVALSRDWMHFVEEAGKESGLQRRRAALVLRLLIEFFKDALAVSLGATPKLAEPEEAQRLQGLTGRLSAEQMVALLERCLEADQQIDRYVQLVLVIEGLLDALGRLLSVP
ncbi:MAG TPA: DNA polymerase III subunit delta' [Gemmataceae bacterium]|nr:DNA polymerase III subunit delta' [Gemmataceae bacterium]